MAFPASSYKAAREQRQAGKPRGLAWFGSQNAPTRARLEPVFLPPSSSQATTISECFLRVAAAAPSAGPNAAAKPWPRIATVFFLAEARCVTQTAQHARGIREFRVHG